MRIAVGGQSAFDFLLDFFLIGGIRGADER